MFVFKHAIINLKDYVSMCSRYVATVALNHEIICKHPERMQKIRPFTDQYNWKDIKNLKKFDIKI